MTTFHAPEVRTWDDGVGIGCSCGWIDPNLWGEEAGAREAFANHILNALLPVNWGLYVAEEAKQ